MPVMSPSPTLYPSDSLLPGEIVSYVMQTIVGGQLMDDRGWLVTDDTAAWYLDAIGALFQEVAFVVSDIGLDGDADYQTGYGSLFTINPRFPGDTAICPTNQLPYVGQYVGVTVPPDASDATARSLITSEQGMQRGTASAINAAATRFLTSTQSLVNLPRAQG